MLKIAVVDDDMVFVNKLSNIIAKTCNQSKIEYTLQKYSNGMDILSKYSQFHLIFLDIEMPFCNGIETAEKINKLKGNSQVPLFVFVTSHDELVFEALKSYPYTFIRKSSMETDVAECIKHINDSLRIDDNTIFLHAGRKDVAVNVDDIIFLDKINNYVIFHTENGDYKVRSNINKEFKKICDYGFVRPHIGYVVNNNYIQYIASNSILLKNNISVPLNKKYKEAVKTEFFNWIGDRDV